MRIALALFASIITLIFAPSAYAECENTVYAEVDSSYGFPDLGVTAEARPVLQGGVSRTCGKITYDVWTSTTLSSKGSYGNRGGGDEIDLTVTWNDSAESPIGTLEFEAQAAYWVIADYKRVKDDIVGFYAQVGRPMKAGPATVTPYLRVTQWIGLGDYPDTVLVRPGVGVNVPLSERWSLDGDVSHVSEDAFHGKVWRAEASLTRTFEKGWSVSGGVKAAEGMPTVFALGFARTF